MRNTVDTLSNYKTKPLFSKDFIDTQKDALKKIKSEAHHSRSILDVVPESLYVLGCRMFSRKVNSWTALGALWNSTDNDIFNPIFTCMQDLQLCTLNYGDSKKYKTVGKITPQRNLDQLNKFIDKAGKRLQGHVYGNSNNIVANVLSLTIYLHTLKTSINDYITDHHSAFALSAKMSRQQPRPSVSSTVGKFIKRLSR